MRVDQFFKLREADTDDLLEVYCILNDVTEEQKNELLTKKYKTLAKLCNKLDVSNIDFTVLDKPSYIKLGRWIYHTPKDFSDLTIDQYYQISGLLNDLSEKASKLYTDKFDILNHVEEQSIYIIPDVVAIVVKCDREKVMRAEAKKVFPLGAFFLHNILSYKKLKEKLREPNLMKTQ